MSTVDQLRAEVVSASLQLAAANHNREQGTRVVGDDRVDRLEAQVDAAAEALYKQKDAEQEDDG